MAQLVLISIIGSCLLSAGLVPIVRASFRRWGIVDRPDKERKLHEQAVSLGGGLAFGAYGSLLETAEVILRDGRFAALAGNRETTQRIKAWLA